MSLLQFTFLVIVHYIADFIFQTREMGTKKSSSIKWLSLHVLVYITVFVTFTLIFVDSNISFSEQYLKWFIVNGILHWITDFFSSKLSSYFYKNKKEKLFWSTIGFDQLIHILTLTWTLKIIVLNVI